MLRKDNEEKLTNKKADKKFKKLKTAKTKSLFNRLAYGALYIFAGLIFLEVILDAYYKKVDEAEFEKKEAEFEERQAEFERKQFQEFMDDALDIVPNTVKYMERNARKTKSKI